MLKLNENYLKLPGSYLFAEIARRTAAYGEAHPDKRLIKLGIGDVTLPLPAACVDALKRAADEMGDKATFMGYGPYEGYAFLREAIAANDYLPYGAKISPDEIFVSDGAKSDCGNIGDIFSEDCVVAVCDPVYPVYIDANAMSGRAGDYVDGRWTNIVYMPCTAENNFFPELPERVPDLIYLCFPNNPTGMAATKEQLKPWVDYANEHGSVILYDAAYRAYISDPAPAQEHLRDTRRGDLCHRVLQLLEDRGLYGHALRLDGHTALARARRREPLRHVDAPPVDEVQRHGLRDTACGRGGVLARGQGAGRRANRLLHE